MHDLVVRGGFVVDGSGRPGFSADVAVTGGRITEIGRVTAPARRTIDADGALVTPGFVDVHTHYDGQFLWDETLDPSFSNGVTTVVAGNCGVGFAPVVAEHRQYLIEMMEGVEEIPGVVLDEGLDWDWKTFPDYLGRLAARRFTMDVAVHATHAPLRVFVMGERALRHEPSTPADVAEMARLVSEAMAAGAVGFSTGRLLEHRSIKGDVPAGSFADDRELMALGQAMAFQGKGVFQTIPKGTIGALPGDEVMGRDARMAEHTRMERIARACGRPVLYTLQDLPEDPGDCLAMMDASLRAWEESGLRLHPQVPPRPPGLIVSLDGYHPFQLRPAYRAIAHLPGAERARAMREPDVRRAILAGQDLPAVTFEDKLLHIHVNRVRHTLDQHYVLEQLLDYEPTEDRRLDTLARAAGKTCLEFMYDHLSAEEGRGLFFYYLNGYSPGDLSRVAQLLEHPLSIAGGADGGAHLKIICDAAMPSFNLAFWTRDRLRGPRFELERMVKKLTSETADLYGFSDRGTLAPGRRADINVIDYPAITVPMPRFHFDLPQGSPRLMQPASGYLATLVAGEITRLNDMETGARPGRLARS